MPAPDRLVQVGPVLRRADLVGPHGLRASLLHQALEWPDLRSSLSPTPGRTDHVQMLIRLGYGSEGSASPRRTPRMALDGVPASR